MAAQELNVQVISNNIANLRTTGYKRQQAHFQVQAPLQALPTSARRWIAWPRRESSRDTVSETSW
jgi:flagellar basal body rod protein FlgB